MTPQVKPLSYRHRNLFFILLAAAFFLSLPFLFLYATGYRFNLLQNEFVSTGGLYVAAERTGAEIYIDNELVRETRVFRRAFYAQGLEATTHRVHVQKEGHHTWVKELPVYPHLVTEAQSFNLPLIATVRLITPWRTTGGVSVLMSSSTILGETKASNQYLFEPRAATSTLIRDSEFDQLWALFEPSATTTKATSTIATTTIATTTKEWRGVRLYKEGGDVFATFVGSPEQMPYYYCAEPFPPYDPGTSTTDQLGAAVVVSEVTEEGELILPVQSVSPNEPCDPVIKIDRGGEEVSYFDFFPNSTDLVIMAEQSGVFVVEIDDRSWQNRQPLILGQDLETLVHNGSVYVSDGRYVYQIMINQDWF